MVKIRYAELPAGLHVVTEERDGRTIIYLQPGLTPAQRRVALTFARRSARIGHGPRLPATGMAVALAADRARTTCHNLMAALRRHPTLLLPLVAVVSAVIVITMLCVVKVGVTPASARANGLATHHTSSLRPLSSTTPTPSSVATTPSAADVDRRGPALLSGTPSPGDTPGQAAGYLCLALDRVIFCLRP
jgi:hypothetical protein